MLLEKILQSQGFGSRKYCQQLIKKGSVRIDNQICDNPKQNFSTEDLSFEVFGEKHQYREHIYIVLHKPQGYECSHQATHHRSVFSLLPEILVHRGVQCVGRLDQDTTGLLLLTDDGQYLQALTHPKKHVPKVYCVSTADPVTTEQKQQLELGVELRNEKGIYAATDIKLISERQLAMTIHQGVYHQVKRMIAAVGNKVERLHRQQIGLLELPNLEEGHWDYLTPQQKQLSQNIPLETE
ncbi:pseudouridine synthase [Acinetobacter haemolyticus]|uniref:pseudouridine synthase n=1 Tax=Acinetobacter haemolyticus TaxID=29430 RepID=UPI000F74E3F3|nr:16S rRNA pseudouridine(516) synthase [Acinetobacter haemolyticus]AZN69416.1 16S rRNA pseudouridine(516) synthase [Acinetobacter haemolyticus]MCU4386685.1 16S rRNA pseudouridine(516) synthase [Acinetobacter haemolyticus]